MRAAELQQSSQLCKHLFGIVGPKHDVIYPIDDTLAARGSRQRLLQRSLSEERSVGQPEANTSVAVDLRRFLDVPGDYECCEYLVIFVDFELIEKSVP